MIFISNQQKNIYELREEFKEYDIITLDCYEKKKIIQLEILQILKDSRTVFNKKRIYFFLDSLNMTEKDLSFLVHNYYLGDYAQKDIYLCNIGKHYHLFNGKWKRDMGTLYKTWNMDYNLKAPTGYEFIDILKQIMSMKSNRNNIDYKSIKTTPLHYILKLIGYNIIDSPRMSNDDMIKTLDIISNISKLTYKIKSTSIQNLINHTYNPFYITKVRFPPKHNKETKDKPNDNIKVSLKELENKDIEFMKELDENIIVPKQKSMF